MLVRHSQKGDGGKSSPKVHTKLFELRIHGKQEVRIFYTFHRDEAVLLHGFVKKSKRIPKLEVAGIVSKIYCTNL
ncbi:MAG: type II toxin-antitoxin system RelE/ParE family toxin [Candidatus Sungbacteria bacterium]|uniref:Type II toxin-antitoxin system RelE/ParE family toxin n=1 Tax=Candidatus Sungiibacteriota bacterium TaxID=2750080 RepID=A0A9D6LP14_9BACT|nr:type II toxin-antitoxin system RelE/ParE family toxin [Candidatus Sungbacteria bacterium]